jgi:hypothetical protein
VLAPRGWEHREKTKGADILAGAVLNFTNLVLSIFHALLRSMSSMHPELSILSCPICVPAASE